MDPGAARRARRKRIKWDLSEAYTDEEATPPEWVDLLTEVKTSVAELAADVTRETARFTSEPDIRRALERRARFERRVREQVAEVNAKIRRLNLVTPHARFTRAAVDAEELLLPLFRTERPATGTDAPSGG